MRAWAVAFAAVACIAPAVACGGDDAGSTPTAMREVTPALTRPPGVDAALADSMLFTRDDLPEDYLERRHDPDAAKTAYLSCTTDPADTATGAASSDDWLFDGQSPAISETVRVYPTEAAATDRASLAPAHVACMVDAINAGKLDGDGVPLSGGAATPVSIDAGADQAAAFQVHATQTFPGENQTGTTQYTIAVVRRGRVVREILIRGSGTPFDQEELSEIMQSAAARIRQ